MQYIFLCPIKKINAFFIKYAIIETMNFALGGIDMKSYDLIVAGGGLTGVAASVGAAREGLKVLLIERGGCLGGAMSNALVYPFMKHYVKSEDGSKNMLSAGIFAEMCRRHREAGGGSERGWQSEIFKIILDDMVTEAGVDVLFHNQLISVTLDGRCVKSVQVAGKSGINEYGANFFIDATGDGDLMAFAGCEYQLGREADGLCQPMTTCFRMSGVDIAKFNEERTRLLEEYNKQQREGKISNPRENILAFYGVGRDVLHLNTTRVIKHNPIDDIELSKAEIIARRQVLEMFNFLCENSEACKNASLVSIAKEIGVRESRKLKGVHILKGEELRDCIDFEDSVAVGNYDIDIHNPEGTGTYIYSFKRDEHYRIPYRALLPKETDNMLVAGRCLSADHEAHSAVRIMPICACLGEAAGIAAAVAKQTETNAHTLDVKIVQEKLIANGGIIH